jgi:hypothetical protein
MTPDEFDRISDAIMGPVLEKMAPAERKKLLLVMRKLVHQSAYGWIDVQLKNLGNLPTDQTDTSRN